MKKYLLGIVTGMVAVIAIAAVVSNRTPLYDAFLQSPLDGNANSITNLNPAMFGAGLSYDGLVLSSSTFASTNYWNTNATALSPSVSLLVSNFSGFWNNGGDISLNATNNDSAVSNNIVNLGHTYTGYNIYSQWSASTNSWSGAPTNTIDMAGPQLMEISTFTSVAITGIINKSTADAPVKTLKIFNASATNQTITLDGGITTRDGLRQYVNTNGQTFIISIQWDPGLSQTNSSYVREY